MTRMTRPALLLAFTTTLFSGCDEDSDVPDDEFRGTTVCIMGVTPPATKITTTGQPQPDAPTSQYIQLAEEQTDEFMFAFATYEMDFDAECKALCGAKGFDWGGDPCIGKRDYKYGDVEQYETAKGDARFRVPVGTGNTEVGCACE